MSKTKCIFPFTLNNDKYGTIEERPDLSGIPRKTVVVPCGKCPPCKRRNALAWGVRLQEQLKDSIGAVFITLTYEETHKTKNELDTLKHKDIQDFFKRLRITLERQAEQYYYPSDIVNDKPPKLKYYVVGEYGSKTMRPHYHAIVYNLPPQMRLMPQQFLQPIWKHGFVHVGDVSPKSIHYTLKYVAFGWEPLADYDDREPPKTSMSQGLGLNYLTPETLKFHRAFAINWYTDAGGHRKPLHRYYKERIFNTPERRYHLYSVQKQWLQEQEEIDNYHLDPFDYEQQKIQQWEILQEKKAIVRKHKQERKAGWGIL